MTMLIAGHETSAAVLTWTLFELHRNPQVGSIGRSQGHASTGYTGAPLGPGGVFVMSVLTRAVCVCVWVCPSRLWRTWWPRWTRCWGTASPPTTTSRACWCDTSPHYATPRLRVAP
jgi:hypothetical protein